MGDNTIQIRVAADMAGLKGQFTDLGNSASGAFKQAAGGAEPLNAAILNQHQSIHLLAEEAGIHLPRAIVSGLAEMLPPINTIGPALMAAFAVEGIVKFGEMVAKDTRELYDFKEAQKQMNEASSENIKILEEQARASMAYARSQLALVTAGMAREQQYVDQLHDWQDSRVQWLGWFGEMGMKLSGATEKIQAEEKKLADTEKLHLDLVKILGENEVSAHEKAAKSAEIEAEALEKRNRADAEFVEKVLKANIAGDVEWDKALILLNRSVDANNAKLVKQYQQAQELDLIYLKIATDLPRTQPDVRSLGILREQAEYTQHLTQAQTVQIGVMQKIHQEAQAAKAAIGGLASATIQAGVAAAMYGQNVGKAMAQAAKSTLTSIALEAAVRAIYNVGLGIYYEAIQDYPDADLAFAAATVFGTVGAAAGAAGAAIPSGGGGGGRSGGPGGNQSSYGGSPGSGGGPSPGGGGSGSGHGPTIVLNQYGPMVGTMNDLAKALVPVLNQLGTSGQVRLTAYNALTNGAKQTP